MKKVQAKVSEGPRQDAPKIMSYAELLIEPCECVRCGQCNGQGAIRVKTDGYPEWDIETCGECGGTGTI